jgi:hypothetical protein
MKPTKTFVPHIDQYRSSFALSSAGVAAGTAAWVFGAPVIAGVVGLVAAGFALRTYKDGTKRQRGLDVEAQHVAALAKVCGENGWALEKDVWLDGIGNMDAVVTARAVRLAVEIKSYFGLREEVDGSIVRCTKACTPADKEVRQVKNQAAAYAARFDVRMPEVALWCPESMHGTARVARCGVTLVNGGVRTLAWHIARVTKERMASLVATPAINTRPALPRAPERSTRTAFEELRFRGAR